MSKLLLLLVGILGVLCVVRGDGCSSDADCYNNGNCINSECECYDNYNGDNCQLEAANCTLAQIRNYEGNYQICILFQSETYWSYVCGDVNLCEVADALCQNCDFSCADTFVCSFYSSGCVSGNGTNFCDVSRADTLSSLITLILVIALIPILM